MAKIIPDGTDDEEEEIQGATALPEAAPGAGPGAQPQTQQQPGGTEQGVAGNGARPRTTSHCQRRRGSRPHGSTLLEEVPSDYRGTAEEGAQLYFDLVDEEMRLQGLEERLHEEQLSMQGAGGDASINTEIEWLIAGLNHRLGPVGHDLRQLADRFEASNERRMVRQKAEGLDPGTLSFEDFLCLLQAMFEGGEITRERVLVLLFFCADLAVVAFRQRGLSFFHQMITWSLKYILDHVCKWVQEHGGWITVLKGSVDFAYKLAIATFCIACSFAAVVYIRKNW